MRSTAPLMGDILTFGEPSYVKPVTCSLPCTDTLLTQLGSWHPSAWLLYRGYPLHLGRDPLRSLCHRGALSPGVDWPCLLHLRNLGHWIFQKKRVKRKKTERNISIENKLWREKKRQMPRSTAAAAAATTSLQSCLTLCDPVDGSPPGSPVPGFLHARTLEWVAISFSTWPTRKL